MAKLPPKKGEENSQEWLNTYADMVTLLLTFFVLLFACSNLDETKLQYVYQAFQMRGKYVNTIVAQPADPSVEQNGGITDDSTQVGGDGNMPQSYEELYQYLSEYIDNNDLADSIALEQGAAHLTIRFDNSVLFDGNSYMLRDDGKKVILDIIPGLKAVQNSVATATVTGHTSKAKTALSDWTLSAQRACSVVHFMEDYETLDDSKYRVKGCGDTEPIAPNDTLEGQQKNRRVEITFLWNDLDLSNPEVIKDILEHDFKLPNGAFDPEDPGTNDDYENLPDGSVDKIIGFIKDKYPDSSGTNVGIIGPGPVDGSQFIAAEEGDDNSAANDSGGAETDSE